jgi:iron complex transport system substrate-binding protein
MENVRRFLICCICLFLILLSVAALAENGRTIVDGLGRTISVPKKVERVICSGPGCLRLLTYLHGQDLVVAVDDIEVGRQQFDARPYAMANPAFKQLPVFGEFRGFDNPERILSLKTLPQVIFKTYPTMGYDPVELQAKTGIPVITLNYGDLGRNREQLYSALRTMGLVVDRVDRAKEVISFFEKTIDELANLTADIPEKDRPSVFIGGVAHKGPHGYQSTEPLYPPFSFVGAKNVASGHLHGDKELAHSDIAKESIVMWDPDILFLDLSTLQLGEKAGGLWELNTDKSYQLLTAIQDGHLYGLLPYNWYTTNYGSILANAYFIGKILYPDRFASFDPQAKADEIFTFLVGKPVFAELNQAFDNLAFTQVPLN